MWYDYWMLSIYLCYGNLTSSDYMMTMLTLLIKVSLYEFLLIYSFPIYRWFLFSSIPCDSHRSFTKYTPNIGRICILMGRVLPYFHNSIYYISLYMTTHSFYYSYSVYIAMVIHRFYTEDLKAWAFFLWTKTLVGRVY